MDIPFHLVFLKAGTTCLAQLMRRNSDKIHHINKNALSKDSASAFFRLNQNYESREYDTSNKVLPNSQPRQSIDHMCIKPIKSVISAPNGNSF